jgi:MFS superfamily sulfate permease-like transporter
MTKKPTEKLTQIYKFTDLPNLLTYGNDSNIDEIISKLQQAKSEGHDKINLSITVLGNDYYIDDLQFTAWHYAEETDEEFEARVATWQEAERIKRENAKKLKASQDEKDRKEFERLSRKFGANGSKYQDCQ